MNTIEGPPRTWATKKRLRHRAELFVGHISASGLLAPQEQLLPNTGIWIPFGPLDRISIGISITVCRDCFDDSVPPFPLRAFCPGYIEQIDADGDFAIRFENIDSIVWIWKDRRSLFRKGTSVQSFYDECSKLISDIHDWRISTDNDI